jgi:outer membrane protein OmpA-like peptidoglycan-associated protein
LALCGALAVAGCADDPPPEASGDYPDIADSPTEPPQVASVQEREAVADGLRADRREDRYEEMPDARRRSSEVRPPEYTPPAATEAPAATPPTARLDAGEQPTPVTGDIDRQDIPPPPGTERAATAGTMPAWTPPPAQSMPMVQSPAPGYGGGPIVVDSRGVTRMGPGGPMTTPGPYPVAGTGVGVSGYPAGYGAGFGPAVSAPGVQPLSAYGPLGGARTQRVAVIYFADGSANLSGRDQQVLRQVAVLQQRFGGVIRVVGHASSRTGAMDITRHKLANFNVSLARANAVARALTTAGVPGRFLYVGAVSDSQPVYYEIMPTGEAGNRRAEIYMDY